MLFDHLGRKIERRKQYGFDRSPVEYVLSGPARPQLAESGCEAIGFTAPTEEESDGDYSREFDQ